MQLLDLPRDPKGQLTKIRANLVTVVNSARHSGSKAELLKDTLQTALDELSTYASSTDETPVEVVVEAPKTTKPKAPKKRATAKVNKDESIADTAA